MHEGWQTLRSLRIAMIVGSLICASTHSVQAADQRVSFREFRNNSPELNRQMRRQAFREQFRNRDANKTQSVVKSSSDPKGSIIPRLLNQTHAINGRELSNSAPKHTFQLSGSGLLRAAQGVNLDLGSAERNITLGEKLFGSVDSVDVTIGGDTKSFGAGSRVTAAEYLAVKQVLAGTRQQLLLDSSGRASGGQVDMSSVASGRASLRASDFIVPANVTTFCDFSGRSEFRLLGDLTNSGTIHASANRAGVIRAEDISNNSGALILSDTDLTLTASGRLTNEGTIQSTGKLTLSASDMLKNSSKIVAAKGISLFAPTIRNSGLIESNQDNVLIDGPATHELQVDGSGGTIAARTGGINVRGFDYAGTANTTVSGGDLLSRQLNLNAGQAVMRVSAEKITGTVFQKGSEAHIKASTENLVIGEVCLTGDPTFKNDAGDISIIGDISVAEDLTVVASGNITSVDNITLQAADATQGFNISLIAGAAQVAGGANSSTLPGGGTAETTSLTGFASASGGSILLGDNVTITTRSTGATGAGGNVLVAAFAGGTAGSGVIDLGGTSIFTGGKTATDINGNVAIIAGAQNTTAVTLGNVDTTGGAPSGSINIATAQPISLNGSNIDYAANGSITSGNSLVAGSVLGINADIAFTGNVQSEVISTQAGGNIQTFTGVAASVSVGGNPTGATINAAGTVAYVANSLDGTVSVIDANTNAVIGSPIAVGLSPQQIALSPNGSLAYVSNSGSNSVSVIDTTSHTVIATINVGSNPTGIAANADGSRVYVTNSGSNTITAIDTASNQVIGSPIVTGAAPNAVIVNGANGRVYVGNTGDSSISIVDQSTLSVIQTVTIPTAPIAFGGCPCGTKIFVAAQGDKVYAFAVEPNAVVATIDLPSGANPVGIAINPTGSMAYTTNSGTGDISVITTLTNSVQETISVGGTPQASGNFAGFVGNNPVLFITDSATDSVKILRTSALISPTTYLTSSAGKILTATGPGNFVVTTTGDVSITAAGSVSTFGSSSGKSFQFATRDDITINNPLVVSSVMDMHAIDGVFTNNSSITVNGTAFVASHQIVNNDTITVQSTLASPVLAFQSPSGDLTVVSDPGAVFSSSTSAGAARIEFNPASGSSIMIQGGVFVADTNLGFRGNNGYLLNANAERIDTLIKVNGIPQNVLIQTAKGNLTIDSINTTASAIGPIDLRAIGGSLFVQGNLTSPSSISLLSQNDILNTNFGGTIATPSLNLTSTDGNVGLDSLNPFVVSALTLDISGTAPSTTGAATGNVWISSASTSGVTYTTSTAGNNLFLSAAGSLTIEGDLTAINGVLDVRATSDDITILTVSDSATLTGFGLVNIVNATSNKRSKLLLGANSTIQTTANTVNSGNIIIAIGPTILVPDKKRRPPRNIVVVETGGGEVNFAGKRARALKPLNKITAGSSIGANILLSNDLRGRSLELAGAVTITADP